MLHFQLRRHVGPVGVEAARSDGDAVERLSVWL